MLNSQTKSQISVKLTASQQQILEPLIDRQNEGHGGMIIGSMVPNGIEICFTYRFLPKEIALQIINLVDEHTENAEVENA